jgi:hypothetical protein
MRYGKTHDSELNGSKHYPNFMCSKFVREFTFDFLLLFQISEVCHIFEGYVMYFILR